MGTCERKANQADLGIFRHILAYSAITRDIKELIRYIKTYSELYVPWYIQKPRIFSTRSIFRTLSKITIDDCNY